jgi:hypothetical protein
MVPIAKLSSKGCQSLHVLGCPLQRPNLHLLCEYSKLTLSPCQLTNQNTESGVSKKKENLALLNPTLSWLVSLPQRLTSFRFLNSLGNAHSLLGFSNNKLRQLLTPFPPSETTSADSPTSTSHTPSTRPTPPLADTLVSAQQCKLVHIVLRALIFPGHRILKIGSRWGLLVLYIMQHIPKVQIGTITLLENQHVYVYVEVARYIRKTLNYLFYLKSILNYLKWHIK